MRLWLVLSASIVIPLSSADAQPSVADHGIASPPPHQPSIHQIELEAHAHERPGPRIVPDETLLRASRPKSVERVVYGYYPYWLQDLTAIRWSALTHLAWFAVEMDETGAVTARHGWPDRDTVDAAHAAGVRVDLTFTLFSGPGILALCSDPARRATAIDNMIAEMEDGNADGISVDFEGLSDGTREYFTTFIAELRREMTARGHADKEISIAGPAVNWAGSDGIPEFDLDALLDHADIFFIMGYGYFWSGSSRAGPIGMLRLSQDWRPYQSRSMLRTLAEYSRDIPAHKRAQIVWGAPYYGREWITTSDQMAASVIDHVSAVTYSAARSDLAAGRTRRYDTGAENPWYTWQENGSWHQVYYEDEESLAAKYRLALEQDLGGVGIWALNYDIPHQELWDLLESSFGQIPEPAPGHPQNPLAIDSFPFADERDLGDAPSSYFNYYSCAGDVPEYGREWVYRIDVCQSGVLSASVPAYPWVDPDLHLLTEVDQDACIARANLDIETAIMPGRYYLAVDTWVDDLLTTEGPYQLAVDFAPDPGTTGCTAEEICDAGVCACAVSGESLCDERCVDTSNDASNCGACGNACDAGSTCEAGACVLPDIVEPTQPGGCGCAAGGAGGGRIPFEAALLVVALLCLLCYRRRRAVFIR